MKKSEALNGILDDIEKYVQDKNDNFVTNNKRGIKHRTKPHFHIPEQSWQ